ncbi:hypothetical protein ACQEVI_10770 [Promicromonospora sp. CA-289599]|uniref:hypothetical protein n=1 Tax=Promicromonospora sp. CA-289599 TaxID=3240014 RepID=UPI003D95029A
MDKNFQRVLYTALVAGGLMVVGASSAHAAEEGLLDPVAQGAVDSVAEEPAARGDLDVVESAPAGSGVDAADAGPATDGKGLVGDLVGREGIIGSLLEADVAGVVDGALGEDGLVDDLLTGGVEEPGTEEPGTEEPGTEEPGTEEPGTEEPGVEEPGTEEPGTEEPGTEEPGTEEPGTEEPGTEEPGAEEPGTDGPGTDGPGTDRPGTGGPGTGRPGSSDGEGGPRTERPGTGWSGTDGPDVHTPGAGYGQKTGSVTVGGEYGTSVGVSSTSSGDEDDDTAGSDTGRDHADEGVDIGWGDKSGPAPQSYEGSYLSGGLGDDLNLTTEPEAEVEAVPVMVPDPTLPEPGHMITGQLSLISLLLGLGIAALRTRRR